MAKTIDREAGGQSKGFLLQKYRACILALDTVNNFERYEQCHLYFAVENKGDVYINKYDGDKSIYQIEENKNYGRGISFSINSKQILNTLVAFLDLWFEFKLSNQVTLSFYTNRGITKERSTKTSEKLDILFPDSKILESLVNDQVTPETLEIVKKLTIKEYREQYSGHNQEGNIKAIEKFSDEDWLDFLNRIQWNFEQPDDKEIRKKLDQAIRNCKHYNSSSHSNKEEQIEGLLLSKLDSRQASDIVSFRFMTDTEIENVYLKVAYQDSDRKPDDPVYNLWNTLEASDTRNLREKIISVCNGFSKSRLDEYSRKVALSMMEKEGLQTQRDFLAMKARAYLYCEDLMRQWFKDYQSSTLTEKEIEKLNKHLIEECQKYLKEMRSDYHYSFSSRGVIEGIVVQLFDDCYLSYDKLLEE